ncbi:MAG: GGDEF domain-containing protein [Cytophagales bacterium]|nr:GGDEF domain-containing protein [Rhizobacter sp.]
MLRAPFLTYLADLVLTREPARRWALAMWLTSVVTYLLYAALMWLQVWWGYTPARAAGWLMLCMCCVNALLYAGIRHSWGPPHDRSLGVTQLLVGIVFMWFSYALAGPLAGATLIIVASHIVYAMFGLSTKHVWQIVAGSLAGLALTMLLCHQWQPERYPAGQQFISFLYTCLVVVLIARLTALVTKMNDGLRTQRGELALALEKVRQLATRDDLTQVHNRRHITELMSIEQTQHERSGSPLCLALLDIDFFKVVNDTFGHQAGDDVLRRFAEVTQQALRTSDLLGRWGGEEFVVAFPDTGIAQAKVALQRARDQLKRTDFSTIAQELRITFSVGLVQIGPQEKVEAAIERADQAMYRAKTNGRDCVESDAETGLPEKAALRA